MYSSALSLEADLEKKREGFCNVRRQKMANEKSVLALVENSGRAANRLHQQPDEGAISLLLKLGMMRAKRRYLFLLYVFFWLQYSRKSSWSAAAVSRRTACLSMRLLSSRRKPGCSPTCAFRDTCTRKLPIVHNDAPNIDAPNIDA